MFSILLKQTFWTSLASETMLFNSFRCWEILDAETEPLFALQMEMWLQQMKVCR